MVASIVITRQRKIDMKELQAHEQRVVDESTYLQDKVSKLALSLHPAQSFKNSMQPRRGY